MLKEGSQLFCVLFVFFLGVWCFLLFWFTMFFPHSHAMGSCKTNRRTGPVGSPSDLVGGWCPGQVVMVSRSFSALSPHRNDFDSCFKIDPLLLGSPAGLIWCFLFKDVFVRLLLFVWFVGCLNCLVFVAARFTTT